MNATQSPELWKPVVAFEGYYEVSSLGRIRAVARVAIKRNGVPMPIRATLLKTYRIRPTGYNAVKLQKGGRETRASRLVHQAVLEAFVGPRPDGYVACHNDGDIDNNVLSNLRWDTQSQNMYDVVKHGRHPHASKTHCIHGHSLHDAYVRKSGGRNCRTCRYERRMETRKAADD